MLKTIKSKFIFFSILLIIVSVGIPNYFLIQQFRTNFRERSELYLNSSMDMILFNLSNSMRENHSQNIQKAIDNMVLNKNVNHIRIFNSDGLVLFSTIHGDINNNIQVVAPNHIDLNLIEGEERKINLMDDDHAFTAFQAIKNEIECQNCHGNESIIAFIDVDTHLTTPEKNFNTGVIRFIYLGIALIILLAVGLLIIFNYFINKPLYKINEAITKLGKGDFGLQLPVGRDDEFGNLNKHFNRMVYELDNSQKEIEQLHNEQLRRADKMVTLGEIAASMAHDINNHSAIIMARADYLQMQTINDSSFDKFNEELSVIIDQVYKISKTTGYILKNAKRVSSKFSYFSLSEILDSTISNIDPLFKMKNVSIEWNSSDGDFVIHGNVEQVEQVIMNLSNNALDAMEAGGKLKISVGENQLGEIELSISDNGKGIPPENIDRIFSPFFTTKIGEKGTGLGLYIVNNICKNHNAELKCNSQVGKGTEFIITFKSEKDTQ